MASVSPLQLEDEDKRYGRQIGRAIKQSRYLAPIVEAARNRRRALRFGVHLHESIGVATQWRRCEAVSGIAHKEVLRLQSMGVSATKKGAPPIGRIRSDDLATLAAALDPGSARVVGESELVAASKVASLDPADAGAFRLYLAILWLLNKDVISALRAASMSDRIALHMTCWPRLQRAERSAESFGSACQLSHLMLVGTRGQYTFDPNSRILGVPSADNYESLPSKVFRAYAILALACNPSCVLKLDDDHRLLNEKVLEGLFRAVTAVRGAAQYGQVHRATLPSAHHRAWHFGKCDDAHVGTRVLEMPAPLKWATGEAGYILNRQALWRALWGSLYYCQWLDEILYEDLAFAELASKTGVRIVNVQMRNSIAAVTEY